jgi:type IV pilus assembly protein PilC
MTEWVYTARTVQGETRRDEVEMPSREDVIAHLRQQRLVPVSIREKPQEITFTLGGGISTKDIVVFTRQFATMINAGLPLVQALDVLARQADSEALRSKLQDVVFQVESGRTLAEALERHEKTFSRLYVSMVDAGEQGGILDSILERLAEFMEKNEALARKVRGAMIYPVAILLFALSVIVVLLAFIIPTFEEMFAQFNQAMPLPTRIVLGLSDFIRSNALWLAAGGGLAGFGFYRWRQTPDGERTTDRFLLQMPVIGDLIQKTAIARFTRTLGTLLGSGVSILHGLEITAATAGNKVIEEAVLESRSSIARGDTVAGPLERTGVFPPMVTQMIHVGEESGELADMLQKIADFYDDEVDTAVENLLKLIEPALIIVLGVIVGGMIVAMYLPIFTLITTMGA